jgi:hypothetical protein
MCKPKATTQWEQDDSLLTIRRASLVHEIIYPDVNPLLRHRTLPDIDTRGWQDDMTNLLLHIIVSIAATHKAVQSQSEKGPVILSREVYQYRSYALRRLNKELGDPKVQLNDFTLLCVMTLQLAEVSRFS